LTHSEEISGALDFATGVIWVAGWESSSRIRYTIAHEIGHEVLGHEHDLQNHSRLHEIEDEADEFASELLMPEEQIQSALTRHGGPLVPVLAQEFDVSIRAMERRLKHALPPVSESEWRV
jgi:Zn-dependent peptidase ImmA (M78 family)